MNYFVFKGIKSIDKGIILTETPLNFKAQRRVEGVTIPGRNGVLYQDEETYETVVIQLKCALIENSDIDKIKSWLNGEGNLILSTMPNRYYKANIINQIDYTNIANQIHEFPLQIEIYPIAYGLKEKEINITQATTITITESTYNIKPYIKITGNGNIRVTINSKTMILNDVKDYIELDCELEEAYKDDINCNNKVLCDDFFEFLRGKNNISFEGSVSNVQIKYREAYI